jgi:hypothetical protein
VEFDELVQLAADTGFAIGERDRGVFAGAGQDVEGQLRVVVGLGDGLEGKQGDGLFLQFIDGGAARLAGRLKESDDGGLDGMQGVQVVQELGEEPGARLRDEVHGGLRRRGLKEWGAKDGGGIGLQSGGEIDDRGIDAGGFQAQERIGGMVDGDDGDGILEHRIVNGGNDLDLLFGCGEDGGGILF